MNNAVADYDNVCIHKLIRTIIHSLLKCSINIVLQKCKINFINFIFVEFKSTALLLLKQVESFVKFHKIIKVDESLHSTFYNF